MQISARNILKGKISEIVKGATTSHVTIDIGSGFIVTASITNEAVADLQLEKGQAGLCRYQGFRRHGWHRLTVLERPEGGQIRPYTAIGPLMVASAK